MAFDVDAAVAAFAACHEPWGLKVGKRTFFSLPWSAEQALIMQQGWRLCTTNAERKELWHRVLREKLFPRHPSMYWRGDPVKIYHSLPVKLQADAMNDFFEFLARLNAKGSKTLTISTTQPGTDLQRKMERQTFTPKVRRYPSAMPMPSAPTTMAQDLSSSPGDGQHATELSHITPSGGIGE
jgi:hypothetical protein